MQVERCECVQCCTCRSVYEVVMWSRLVCTVVHVAGIMFGNNLVPWLFTIFSYTCMYILCSLCMFCLHGGDSKAFAFLWKRFCWDEPERAPQLLVSIAPACVRVYVCTYVAASDVWERVRRQMSENEYSIV